MLPAGKGSNEEERRSPEGTDPWTNREEREPARTAEEREPACPVKNPTRETQGLTNSSSATEAGDARRRQSKKNPAGQPLFAGARG